MKKLIIVACLSMLLGCAGIDLQDTPTNKAIAYGSGKGLAIAVHELTPPCTTKDIDKSCVDADLTNAWVDLMERTQGMVEIPSAEMIMFYNECVQIIASPIKDPYGLIGDLSILLTLYAGEFVNGEMVAIQPVPMEIMKFFEMGYDNGRRVARKDR